MFLEQAPPVKNSNMIIRENHHEWKSGITISGIFRNFDTKKKEIMIKFCILCIVSILVKISGCVGRWEV